YFRPSIRSLNNMSTCRCQKNWALCFGMAPDKLGTLFWNGTRQTGHFVLEWHQTNWALCFGMAPDKLDTLFWNGTRQNLKDK
ncbi:hypothetical protein BgiMline_002795, partial [Biomphalaria glabrata]